MNVKGKGQRLIPEELLKYLEAYKENHPDPTEGGGATLDDIVDSQGNKRFVEGNGTPGRLTSLTIDYNKWSLSGTHLMAVVSGQVNANFTIDQRDIISSFEVPEYISNKIVGTNIERKVAYFFTSELTQTTLNIALQKTANTNLLKIVSLQSVQLSQFQKFRIQFDLLIDSE